MKVATPETSPRNAPAPGPISTAAITSGTSEKESVTGPTAERQLQEQHQRREQRDLHETQCPCMRGRMIHIYLRFSTAAVLNMQTVRRGLYYNRAVAQVIKSQSKSENLVVLRK